MCVWLRIRHILPSFISYERITRVFTSASLLSTCPVINKDLPFIVPLHLSLWFTCQKLLKPTLEAHRAPAGGHVRITSTWFSGHIGNLQWNPRETQNECMSLETLFIWQQVSICSNKVFFSFFFFVSHFLLDLWMWREQPLHSKHNPLNPFTRKFKIFKLTPQHEFFKATVF